MAQYSEQDLKYASELREEVHREALAIVRKTRPHVTEVLDRHPVEDYFREHWDYPGRWYTIVAIPEGYKSRQALVDTIVRDTLTDLEYQRFARLALVNGHLSEADFDRLTAKPKKPEGDPFYDLIQQYPDLTVDYGIVPCDGAYRGYESHREALKAACATVCEGWENHPERAVGKRIEAATLFSSDYEKGKLNYRKAFLYPPHTNRYNGKDFVRVNRALFPNGTDDLEVYEWSTDWSDYFDDGHEWWGTLCLTVYDKSKDRFAIIMASATD